MSLPTCEKCACSSFSCLLTVLTLFCTSSALSPLSKWYTYSSPLLTAPPTIFSGLFSIASPVISPLPLSSSTGAVSPCSSVAGPVSNSSGSFSGSGLVVSEGSLFWGFDGCSLFVSGSWYSIILI